MTGKQLKEFERAISKRRDGLQTELRGDVERSREDVFSAYSGDAYAALKAKYDPHGRFPGLYEKCVLRG